MGQNFWGDVYTFGTSGYNYNDFTRTGGVIGAEIGGSYWGSLGYKSSGSVTFGVYGSNAYGSGGGLLPVVSLTGIGGGFFGDMVGTISRGKVIGQLNAGELFATYNIGNVYTSGTNIEMVASGDNKVPAYSVTSNQVKVYSDGKVFLQNGSAYVMFDESYVQMLGTVPSVTATPMGACNGVYIESVDKNGFTIKEQNNGNSNVEISWISVGARIDAKEIDQVPSVLKTKSFDSNILDVLFDDSNKEGTGKAIWWDGSTIKFGQMPTELIRKRPANLEMK